MKKRMLMVSAAFALAVGAAEAPFGVCAHITQNEDADQALARAAEAGIGHIRADFPWWMFQRQRGGWTPERFQSVIDKARGAGVTLLPIVCGGTDWASPTTGSMEHIAAFGAFAGRVAGAWPEDLPVIEIWNEQNAGGFWPPRPNADHYVKTLRASSEAIKRVNPSAQVAFGGLAGVDPAFLEAAYKCGAKDAFDIMNVHPYCAPNAPEGWMEKQLGILRGIMRKYGDEKKPVWITEMGWSTKRIEWPAAERGMVRGAFRALGLSGRKDLRVLAIEQSHPGATDAWYSDVWRHELPEGTELTNATYADVTDKLARGGWDAVVMPFDESYPAHAADALVAYVRGGGAIIDFGGVPGYFAFGRTETGAIEAGPLGNEEFRAHLRIKSVMHGGAASAPANGFDTGAGGVTNYPAARGFAADYLRPGDTMKAMMRTADGTAVAALYEFASDFKGKIFAAGRMVAFVCCATSERTQAAMTVRSVMSALRFGVARYYVYEFQAPEKLATDQESHFGILHCDWSPKPAFHAYKTLIGLRPAGSVELDCGSWGAGGIYRAAWRRPDGATVTVLWTGEGDRELRADELPSGNPVDMFGKPVALPRGTLRVTGEPVYFRF